LVLFDIAEEHNQARRLLTTKLRLLGFRQLQQSAWIYPFPCMDIVEVLCVRLEVTKIVSCLEVTGLVNEKALIKRFDHLLDNR